MQIEVNDKGSAVSVKLAGELTIYTVTEIKASLAKVMIGAKEIEVDLLGVTEVDTAGLQLMLLAKRNPDTEVRFVNHPPAVRRLVDLANLGKVLGDPVFISATDS